MAKAIKYVEKGLAVTANALWHVFEPLNRIKPNPSFTPRWSDKPLLKSYQKTKPPLGWPRTTDSLCPKCVPEIRQQIIDGKLPYEILLNEKVGELKAQIIERDGKILMVKECPIHGHFEDVMSIDPVFSKHLEDVFPGRDIRAHNVDIVTIGRALHWMEREPTIALFERLVAPAGRILICASFSAKDGRNRWLDDYDAARRAWSPERLWTESRGGWRTPRDLAAFFGGSAFRLSELIEVETSHEVSVRDLARRVLTFSSSSPAALGDKAEAMLRDVEARLMPFARDGVITEALASVAQVVSR